MTPEMIEMIINEVIRRLKSRTLLVITSGAGYKKEIFQRISQCRNRTFDIVIANEALQQHCPKRWGEIGNIVSISHLMESNLEQYQHILLPFLDSRTLSCIINTIIDSDTTQLLSQILMKNQPVFAFDYSCNPESEFNSVLGLNQNQAYTALLKQNMAKAQQLGIQFCTANHFFSTNLIPPATQQPQAEPSSRYITLNDILNKKITQIEPNMRLTALAQEYIKENGAKIAK